MPLKKLDLFSWYQEKGHAIAGLDEAGRGPLAGPVIAAAVVFHPDKIPTGLSDSKKLSSKKRNNLFLSIQECALAIGIAQIDSNRIDEVNILRASLEAMKLAFFEAEKQLKSPLQGALVDGNQRVDLQHGIEQHTVIGGDNLFAPIMAASIIAKVFRDRLMLKMALKFPGYGFENHKGYGTKEHLDALNTLGPCSIHRQSFAPVRLCTNI